MTHKLIRARKVVSSIDDFRTLEAFIIERGGHICGVKSVYRGLEIEYEL